MNYKHLSIDEREKILFYLAGGLSLCKIAQRLGRNKSTISRELCRNDKTYSPSKAQIKYQKRRKKSCPHKKLDNLQLFDLVRRLFLEEDLSPEQISGRLRFEAYPIQLSSSTIYWAIYSGKFDTPEQRRSKGNRGAIRKLRHKGKSRHTKNYVEKRGKIQISNLLSQRPKEANERTRFGDFEADTIVGFNRKSALLTLVDMKSRFLHCCKLKKMDSKTVAQAMIKLLRNQPLCSITPDRGKEFSDHKLVTKELGVEFYFPPPHHPWERGTNENTNGLLREYFPKGYDFNDLSKTTLEAVVEQLNKRPRKCLGYKSPWEVWFSKSLHFI